MENAVKSSNEKWKINLDSEVFICDSWEYDEKIKFILLNNVYAQTTYKNCVDDRIKKVTYDTTENIVKKNKSCVITITLENDRFPAVVHEYSSKQLQFEFKDVISIGLHENFKYNTKEESVLKKIEEQNENSCDHIKTYYSYIINKIDRYKNSIKKSLPLTSVDKDIILDKMNKLWECKVGQFFNITVDKDKVIVGDIV